MSQPSPPSDAISSPASHLPTPPPSTDDNDSIAPSLLYDDIDHPTTSTTSLLLTAQHRHAIQQLEQTISQLSQQLSHTEQRLRDSRQEADKYKLQCAVFVRNISVLYETAVSEVKRKQDEIDRLKEWKATHERRTRMAAAAAATADRQQLSRGEAHYGANGATVVSSTSSQQLPLPPAKRAHHTMHQPYLPQPPFPPPDLARKRARVDPG